MVQKPRTRKRQRKRKGQRPEKWEAGYPCTRCGSYDIRESIQAFCDKTMHIRNECGKCGKFLKWSNPEHTPQRRE